MFWIYCGLFVLVIAVPGFTSNADSTSKREADYTLDDSFWNEETPVGERKLVLHNDSEVERLLRDYRQNEELLQNIGGHSYQIIYPVQLRHHEKMGISTREAGSPKFPQKGNYGDDYQNGRGRARTGKHFHRTSILIKAFTHKFRLDLELNGQLLAPNVAIKHYLINGAEQFSKQGIEHCYYHGTVRDYPGASAAFHTCNGVSGVIHLGNETFIIHPFYGGDLSKHPHIIFGARTKANKGCGNLEESERRVKSRRQKYMLGLSEDTSSRYKRDVREATKYIETAVMIDKAMFDKRDGSTKAEIVNDAIQVANIADLYFRTLNTRISVVYIETWQGANQITIDRNLDIHRTLVNFDDYVLRQMYQIPLDTIQLLTGETFVGDKSGMSVSKRICGKSSVGVSVDLNIYEPHLLAGTMAHMIGHNIGMGHDDGREECLCRDWHGCIMAKSIVGLENVQPYKFSECSKADYIDALKEGLGLCLLNKPNEAQGTRLCGNRQIDEEEQCDCGNLEECHEYDPCCDPYTCKLTMESECASGPCCNNCKLRARGVVCREATNECDIPEVCSGETGDCPTDVYKKNGTPCSNESGHCFNGVCPAVNLQCEQVWGYGGKAAHSRCFNEFNSKGSINGHCGTSSSGHYIKCERENVLCGSLQCQMGAKQPTIDGTNQLYSRTIISDGNREYECKTTTGPVEKSKMPGMGLVLDGTSCGSNLICINQTCTSLFPHLNQEKCPSNDDKNECSGNGVCTSANRCYCYLGWSGPDCSIRQDITTEEPLNISTTLAGKSDLESKMEKKETPYGGNNNNLSTLAMVFILVGVVKGVFICFALMAVCYRRKSTIPKYDPPYSKKPMQKNYSGASGNHHPEVAALDSVNKFLGFGSMPSYSRGETQRVLFQTHNNVATADGIRLKEHKPQMTRLAVDEEDGGTGAEDVVSFIDLPPNSLAKLPEKGILKKHGGYGIVMPNSCNEMWADDSQSDNQDTLSQQENNMAGLLGIAGGTISEVERTLNSLNGYHENIIEALRNAASHRGLTTMPSGSSSLLSEDVLRKSLAEHVYAESYRKHSGSQDNIDNQEDEDEDDVPPTCDPIRIRTLEDIIRQLEHHSTRHMSPSGSEDIRISENEGDRHYRIDSSVCSESSQGSRRCSRGRDDDSRFVYGRYRQPSSRSPYGTHQHAHQHSHQMHEEEGIYETADPDRGTNNRGETPDSESDAFIQAQQQLARWTSEEGVQHRPPQQPPPLPMSTMQLQYQQQQLSMDHQHREQHMPLKQRSYYPSPPHSDNGLGDVEARNAQSQQNFPDVHGINVNHLPNINKCSLDDNFSLDCMINNGSPKELNTNNISDNENTALLPPSHFPEYKH